MRNIYLFVEDFGHEAVLTALIHRLAAEMNLSVKTHSFSVRGGHGKMIQELKLFINDVRLGRSGMPDLIVVGRDANCKGYAERKKELDSATKALAQIVVYAIPDPHIERWLLLDSSAFKAVLGRGCDAPNYKCERNRYKFLLADAIRSAGLIPLLGGMEHAADIVSYMDLQYLERAEPSLGHLLKSLRSVFGAWHK